MKSSSHINSVLQRLYGIVLRRMRFLNATALGKKTKLHRSRRLRSASGFQTSFTSEALERRILLTEAFGFDAADHTSGVEMKLLLEGNSIVLKDTVNSATLQSQLISENTSIVNITGSSHADSLTIDASMSAYTVNFAGGSGVDSLIGTALTGNNPTNDWQITGANAGTLNAHIAFSQVENLTGAIETIDTYYIQDGGSIAGKIHGNQGEQDRIVTVIQADLQKPLRTYEYTNNVEEIDGVDVATQILLIDDETIATYEDIAFADDLHIVLPNAVSAQNLTAILSDKTAGNYQGWLRLSNEDAAEVFAPIDFKQQINGSLTVQFGDGDDALRFDPMLPEAALRFLKMNVEGGHGIDTLMAPSSVESLFYISGQNLGTVNTGSTSSSNIVFNQIENLHGASSRKDTFVFGPEGALTGTLEGQSESNSADEWVLEVTMGVAPQTFSVTSTDASSTLTRNTSAVATVTGISNAVRLEVLGTQFDDQLTITAENGVVEVFGSNDQVSLGKVSFELPISSLKLSPFLGDDVVTVNQSSLIYPIVIDDAWGTDDRLIVEVSAGASSVNVEFVNASPDEGSISVGTGQITYKGFEDTQNVVVKATDWDDTINLSSAPGGRLLLAQLPQK